MSYFRANAHNKVFEYYSSTIFDISFLSPTAISLEGTSIQVSRTSHPDYIREWDCFPGLINGKIDYAFVFLTGRGFYKAYTGLYLKQLSTLNGELTTGSNQRLINHTQAYKYTSNKVIADLYVLTQLTTYPQTFRPLPKLPFNYQ